jgi:hypothetical protein
MMSSDFSYLKKYKLQKGERGIIHRNNFYPVYESEIKEAEERLGYEFPSELKSFFLEIGYGFLKGDFKGFHQNTYTNRILDPVSIADILLEGVDSGQLHPETEFLEGEMPFFEIGEMRDFFTMYPLGDKPNAVYDNLNGKIIEESFSKFIWRLYYESPIFYLED